MGEIESASSELLPNAPSSTCGSAGQSPGPLSVRAEPGTVPARIRSASKGLAEFLLAAMGVIFLAVGSASASINNIAVANPTSSSIAVTWTTESPADGCVRYGLTTALGDTACDSRSDDELHCVEISGLAADTTYYFEVASGGEIDNNAGAWYTFQTMKVGVGIPYTIYGNVDPPHEWTLVSVTLKKATGDSSYPLAALADSSGTWDLNLGNLKDPSDRTVFSYSIGDTISIAARAGPGGLVSATTTVSGSSPQDCGTFTTSSPHGPLIEDGQGYHSLWVRPNPFRSSTVINYSSPTRDHMRLDVFSLEGRRVATLIDQFVPAGSGSVTWDGRGLASGIYFLRMRVGDVDAARKVVHLK